MKNSLLIYECATNGAAPEWIRILPLGKVELRDGRAPFEATREDLEKLIEVFREEGIRLVVDYEHQSLSGDKAPAAGWITDLQIRDDGLYARVDWTDQARQEIEGGQYNYYSPAVKLNPETRRVTKLMHAGLTNNPAIKRLPTLLAAKYSDGGEPEILVLRDFTADQRKQGAKTGEAMPDGSFPIKSREDVMNAVQAFGRAQDKAAVQKHITARAKELGCMDLLPADWPGSTKKMEEKKAMKNKLLGLPGLTALKAESTDDEVIAALTVRLKQADSLPEIAVALGLEKGADVAQITGTILALKQGSEQLTALSTKLAALETENAQGKAQKAVDEALAAHKISPGQISWALKYATQDAEGFAAYVKAAVPILAAKNLEIPKDDKSPGGVVDEGGLAVCRQMGISPEDFLATKQQMAAAQ